MNVISNTHMPFDQLTGSIGEVKDKTMRMKSIAIDCHGLSGIGRQCAKLLGLVVLDFRIWHLLHELQNDTWPSICTLDIV